MGAQRDADLGDLREGVATIQQCRRPLLRCEVIWHRDDDVRLELLVEASQRRALTLRIEPIEGLRVGFDQLLPVRLVLLEAGRPPGEGLRLEALVMRDAVGVVEDDLVKE